MKLRHAAREERLLGGPGAAAAFARCRELLWSYRFYPDRIVSGELARVEVGAVIHQRIRVGPLRLRGPVRLVRVWDAPARCGYAYEALPGHVERGTASFDLRLEGDSLVFRIESDSAPAHWGARLLPWLARGMQRRAYDAAFKRMREAALA